MLRWTLLIVLAVLAVPTSAQAARFSADAQLQEMTEIGAAYWAERGLTHCQTFAWELADDFPEGAHGQAPVGECYGWLARDSFNFRTRSAYTLTMRCTIVVHELGHGNGLEHVEDGGIMDPFYASPPRVCREWAKRTVASMTTARQPRAAHMAQRRGVLR